MILANKRPRTEIKRILLQDPLNRHSFFELSMHGEQIGLLMLLGSWLAAQCDRFGHGKRIERASSAGA